jgi:hypothetical protein
MILGHCAVGNLFLFLNKNLNIQVQAPNKFIHKN